MRAYGRRMSSTARGMSGVYAIYNNGIYVDRVNAKSSSSAISTFARENGLAVRLNSLGNCGMASSYCARTGMGCFPCGSRTKCHRTTVGCHVGGHITAMRMM